MDNGVGKDMKIKRAGSETRGGRGRNIRARWEDGGREKWRWRRKLMGKDEGRLIEEGAAR